MDVRCADVIRGTNIPFVVLFISSNALGSGKDASLLIATFCAKLLTGLMIDDSMMKDRSTAVLLLQIAGRGNIVFSKNIRIAPSGQ